MEDLGHNSIAGPVYPYDTSRASSHAVCAASPLCTTPSFGITVRNQVPSSSTSLGGALLLELAVKVVALVGPGDVVAVPSDS